MSEKKGIIITDTYAHLVDGETVVDTKTGKLDFDPTKRSRLISTPELTKNIFKTINDKIGVGTPTDTIIPPNCRMVHENGAYKTYVIEEPPAIRTIKVRAPMEKDKQVLRQAGKYEKFEKMGIFEKTKGKEFTVIFPYVVYVITTYSERFQGLQVFYRTSPIRTKNDILFKTNLFNINSSSGDVCLGSLAGRSNVNANERQHLTERVINAFWLNTFNDDITDAYNLYRKTDSFNNYYTWQYMTEIDPMFIFSVNFIPCKTIRECVSGASRDHNMINGMKTSNNPALNTAMIYGMSFTELIAGAFAPRSRTTTGNKTIVRNVTNEVRVSVRNALSVDDMIEYKNVKYFINRFDGSAYKADTVVLENMATGDISEQALDNNFLGAVDRYLNDYGSMSSLEIRPGEEVKVGDLLEFDDDVKGLQRRKITKIREARDGSTEIQFDNEMYLFGVLKNPRKFDMSKITMFGEKLEAQNKFKVLRAIGFTSTPIGVETELTFIGADLNRLGKIVANFKDPKGVNVSLDTEGNPRNYLPINKDNWETPKVLAINSRLHYNAGNAGIYSIIPNKGLAISGVVPDRYGNVAIPAFKMDKDIVLQEIMPDANTISINTIYGIMEYKVGEEVVFADWEYAESMDHIFKITEFNENGNYLEVKLVNADVPKAEPFTYRFINLKTGHIDFGTMRHVIRSLNGLNRGDILKANEARISGFPKKDYNKVLGFIKSTVTASEHMVLMSNKTTIFESDLSKFTVTKPTDKKYSKITVQTTPPAKIQEGDLVKVYGDKKPVDRVGEISVVTRVKSRSGRSSENRIWVSENLNSDKVYETRYLNYRRHGFLSPRKTNEAIDRYDASIGFTDYLGGHYATAVNYGSRTEYSLHLHADPKCTHNIGVK